MKKIQIQQFYHGCCDYEVVEYLLHGQNFDLLTAVAEPVVGEEVTPENATELSELGL